MTRATGAAFVGRTWSPVASFERALAAGQGVVAFESAVIDRPAVERARRMLAWTR